MTIDVSKMTIEELKTLKKSIEARAAELKAADKQTTEAALTRLIDTVNAGIEDPEISKAVTKLAELMRSKMNAQTKPETESTSISYDPVKWLEENCKKVPVEELDEYPLIQELRKMRAGY
jgi:hypothetical protein